ncbi:4'-phosphopantetheinyl transferase family protein [Baaleninema simplex]|uniref:4'-phosphopantetheinyl transferase family protein n=1 Tax=Baaleninema simplex TaxID=2862350 RepID=UPI000346F922|nr:4'-phosphopantetheinyl transferase superfamily protein [Baaleninema simplex]
MELRTLEPDTVDLWCVALDAENFPNDRTWDILSETERERASRYRFARDRRRFVLARSALRWLLGDYLDIPPQTIQFEYGDRGKPFLNGTPLAFNVSHSEDLALIAVTWNRAIGVDLEYKRQIDSTALAERFFSPREVAALNEIAEHQRDDAFFNYWTCKEAYLKATGEGLAGLSRVEVTLTPSPVLWTDSERTWTLKPLQLRSDYAAALVVDGEIAEIRRRECDRW